MSDTIIRLTAGDFDEAMAFLDMVFGEHAPHDFAAFLPSIYQPTDEAMRCNYAIRDGKRLGAIVGVFPIDWRVNGIRMKVAGIGGVSVHPDSRGKGYMKTLMNHAVCEMKREGCDLSYLGGRRQRYAYFGFEVSDTYYRVNFLADNIRHTFKGRAPAVTFEPVTEDLDTLSQLKALHDAQPQYCDRPAERFLHFLKSWDCKPSLARDTDGQIVGYVSQHPKEPVLHEFVALNEDVAAEMVHRLFLDGAERLTVLLYPPAGSILRRLNTFAESTRYLPNGNWQVFNWAKVLDALIKSKHAAEPMPGGEVVLAIEGETDAFKIMVDGDQARCEAADQTPNLSLSPLKAVQALLGPGSPSTVIELPKTASLLSAWCPLPLGISTQDHV